MAVTTLTATGEVRCVFVVSPSCPFVLRPDALIVPPVLRTSEWLSPAATATPVVIPVIWTGDVAWIVLPFPSCPNEFRPHDQTVPSDLTARLWKDPAAMAVIELRPLIRTGWFRV